MSIPTTEEFNSWLSRATTPLDVGVPLPEVLTVETAANYLLETQEGRIRTRDALVNEATFQWLNSQREYHRAQGKVFAKRRRAAETASNFSPRRAVDVAAEFLERADQTGARKPRFRSQEDQEEGIRADFVKFACKGFETTWDWRTMQAVAEYLEGKTAKRFQKAVCEIQAAAEAAHAAVARYQNLVEEFKSPAFRDIPVNTNRLRTHSAPWFPTAMLGIESPLGRKDSTIDERLFVYRMLMANRRSARSAKADAIVELMGLEGFRHQYDLRTIEKLCARFIERVKASRAEPIPAEEPAKSNTSRRGKERAVRAA